MDIVTPALAAVPLAPQVAAPVATAAPDERAAARFAEIMGQPPVAPTGAAQALDPALRIGEVPASGSMGDRILGGMQGVAEDFQGAWNKVSAALDSSAQMSTQDLLKLQMQLTQVSVQYELVGKAISRSTQNLDQLVKVQ